MTFYRGEGGASSIFSNLPLLFNAILEYFLLKYTIFLYSIDFCHLLFWTHYKRTQQYRERGKGQGEVRGGEEEKSKNKI